MCLNPGGFDMRSLDHAGLAGVDPYGAVTFVENHDTDRSDPVSSRKMMAYAYILTSEGYPKVFYRDYSQDPGCYGLKPWIDNLIWIRTKIASGSTLERWKSDRVFVFERLGGTHLVVGLNNQSNSSTVTVQTGFPANTTLVDYTGNSPNVTTNGSGQATITIPGNGEGRGYVAYSVAGFAGELDRPQIPTTQEYAGATDLDIKPAEGGRWTDVCRIETDAKPIRVELYMNRAGWASKTEALVQALNTRGEVLGAGRLTLTGAQGNLFKIASPRRGWVKLRVQLANARGLKSPYWLKVIYTAPREAN
jgi:alpha-amylase